MKPIYALLAIIAMAIMIGALAFATAPPGSTSDKNAQTATTDKAQAPEATAEHAVIDVVYSETAIQNPATLQTEIGGIAETVADMPLTSNLKAGKANRERSFMREPIAKAESYQWSKTIYRETYNGLSPAIVLLA